MWRHWCDVNVTSCTTSTIELKKILMYPLEECWICYLRGETFVNFRVFFSSQIITRHGYQVCSAKTVFTYIMVYICWTQKPILTANSRKWMGWPRLTMCQINKYYLVQLHSSTTTTKITVFLYYVLYFIKLNKAVVTYEKVRNSLAHMMKLFHVYNAWSIL